MRLTASSASSWALCFRRDRVLHHNMDNQMSRGVPIPVSVRSSFVRGFDLVTTDELQRAPGHLRAIKRIG